MTHTGKSKHPSRGYFVGWILNEILPYVSSFQNVTYFFFLIKVYEFLLWILVDYKYWLSFSTMTYSPTQIQAFYIIKKVRCNNCNYVHLTCSYLFSFLATIETCCAYYLQFIMVVKLSSRGSEGLFCSCW